MLVERTGNLDSAKMMVAEKQYDCIVSEYEVPPGSGRFYNELNELRKDHTGLYGIVTNWDFERLKLDEEGPDFLIAKFRGHGEIAHHLYTAVTHPENILDKIIHPETVPQWCNPIKYTVEYSKGLIAIR